jgi:hypothetical protein
LLNEGQVTTYSGRQANFQVVDVTTIVWSATNKVPPFETTTLPFGTTVDVFPRVAEDGHTVDLKVIPGITEFLGYQDLKTGKISKTPLAANRLGAPRSRIRRTAMDTMISGGDTLLLTDFGDEWVTMSREGLEQRIPYKDKNEKRLVVFLTTSVFEATNRVNARNAVASVKPGTDTNAH